MTQLNDMLAAGPISSLDDHDFKELCEFVDEEAIRRGHPCSPVDVGSPPTKALTQVEYDADDFPRAQAIAAALGYEQTAYTSSSSLWGLFCLPENPRHAKPGQATKSGCVVKTRELGFLFVQDTEDLGLRP